LLTGGDEGTGTLVLTAHRLVWIKSKGGHEALAGGPKVDTVDQLESLWNSHGGLAIPLDEIHAAEVSQSSGYGSYGYGRGPMSELTVQYGSPTVVKTFRFYGKETAEEVRERIAP